MILEFRSWYGLDESDDERNVTFSRPRSIASTDISCTMNFVCGQIGASETQVWPEEPPHFKRVSLVEIVGKERIRE